MDRDEPSMNAYLASMPWLAVKYTDAQTRTSIPQTYQVNGIPHLKIFSPSGQLLEQNAVEVPLSWQTFSAWNAGKSAAQAQASNAGSCSKPSGCCGGGCK